MTDWTRSGNDWLYGTPENGIGLTPRIVKGRVHWSYGIFVNGEEVEAGVTYVCGPDAIMPEELVTDFEHAQEDAP